jgi:hypothetical protein
MGSWWMAEVGSEEVAACFEVIIGCDNLSFSPFTLTAAYSLISIEAFLDFGDILGHVVWSTVVSIWDQIDSVVIDTWGCAGTGWHVKAYFPISSWDLFNTTSRCG